MKKPNIAKWLDGFPLAGKGIQSAIGNELLKTQYLMNNTILKKNGLWWRI